MTEIKDKEDGPTGNVDVLSKTFQELETTHNDTLKTRELLRKKLTGALDNLDLDIKKHSDKELMAMLGIVSNLNIVLNDIDRQVVDRTKLRLSDKRNENDENQAAIVTEFLKQRMRAKRKNKDNKDVPLSDNESKAIVERRLKEEGVEILPGEIDQEEVVGI